LIDHQLLLTRVWASAVAFLLTMLLGLLLKASHPPAGATTLMVTLGAIKTPHDAINLLIGVLLLALFGEGARHLRSKTAAPRSG
jgi:CBS-domain-containing membrane protein